MALTKAQRKAAGKKGYATRMAKLAGAAAPTSVPPTADGKSKLQDMTIMLNIDTTAAEASVDRLLKKVAFLGAQSEGILDEPLSQPTKADGPAMSTIPPMSILLEDARHEALQARRRLWDILSLLGVPVPEGSIPLLEPGIQAQSADLAELCRALNDPILLIEKNLFGSK